MRLKYKILLTFAAIIAYLLLLYLFPFFKKRVERSDGGELDIKKIEALTGFDGLKQIKWGIIQHREKNHHLHEQYQKVASYLSSKIGIPVEVIKIDSYREIEAAISQNKIQMANLSSFAFVRLQNQYSSKITSIAAELYHGSKYYVGYIFTHIDSPYRTVNDLKNTRFAFVNKKSASGYLFPYIYLKQRGIEPETYFSKIIFAGSHQNVLQKVVNHEVDAGASFDASFIYLAQSQNKFKLLGKTPRIPGGVITVNDSIIPELRAQIKKVFFYLTRLNNEWIIQFRKLSDITGWTKVVDEDFDIVRTAVKTQNLK